MLCAVTNIYSMLIICGFVPKTFSCNYSSAQRATVLLVQSTSVWLQMSTENISSMQVILQNVFILHITDARLYSTRLVRTVTVKFLGKLINIADDCFVVLPCLHALVCSSVPVATVGFL